MKITKKKSKGLKREFNIVISAKEIEDKINGFGYKETSLKNI